MHFIFVACNKNRKLYRNDPSFIYRCENLAFGLEALGHTAEFTHLSSFPRKHKADVVLFHRPSYSLKLFATVLYLKQKSVLTVLDVDDLVFDPKYAAYSPAVRNKILSLKKVQREFQKKLKAFKLFSHFTVSTDPLAEHIDQLIPHNNSITLPNTVHHSWKSLKEKPAETKTKKLTYFPGTRSHDKDFETISKGLSQFLNNHPEVTLYITGPLKFDLDVLPAQIVYHEKVPFSEHWRNYQNVWVNLAPLERIPFTECKSALKVIEAGYWGIPTVCTPNSDTKRFLHAGAVIAENEDEWLHQLEALSDPKVYAQITKDMETHLVELADVKKVAQLFLDYIAKQTTDKQKYLYSKPLFPMKIAKTRRKQGLYDCKTLWFYKKAWQKKKNPNAFVEYCMFRRDLGYTLSSNRVHFLMHILEKLGTKHKKYALSLLKEVSEKHIPALKEHREWLRSIQENQEQWRHSFKEALAKSKTGGICVVGNAATLQNTMLGDKIDQHGLVVRFNQCWSEDGEYKDRGKQLDIWVSAPDYQSKTQSKARWIIVSGPDMLYKEAGWKRFKDTIDSHTYLLTVPLDIWKALVFKLHAPPSAGILVLCWFREIFGNWDGICATGFDFKFSPNIYHHADPKHPPGKRHNWEKEKKLLQQWKDEGLEFLL